jgi:multimeric flavodoxin WrbA
MKIIAVSGSPRDKRTNYMIRKVLEGANTECELITLKDLEINHCVNCGICRSEPFVCVQKDDFQALHDKLIAADALVFGSPVYFDNVSGLMKDFYDRCLGLYWSKKLNGKKIAIVACAGGSRQSSLDATFLAMENFCKLQGLNIVGKVGSLAKQPELQENELLQLGKELILS